MVEGLKQNVLPLSDHTPKSLLGPNKRTAALGS